jgi:hypothetical protein
VSASPRSTAIAGIPSTPKAAARFLVEYEVRLLDGDEIIETGDLAEDLTRHPRRFPARQMSV